MSKRLFDLTVAATGLILFSPVMLVIALLIKLTSPGTIFYRAKRIGRGEQPIMVYKFRTMQMDADQLGPGITTAADQRITRIGHFLRRYKLDEMPQLINILKGDMSLVGPRPEDPRYLGYYTPEQRRVLSVRPGMTSSASLLYRDEQALLTGNDWEKTYIDKIMPAKLALDLEYLDQQSFWYDLRLIWQTIRILL